MKKIISIILSLILVLSLSVPAFAEEGKAVDYNGYPLVIVRGINYTGLYFEDESPALSFSFGDVMNLAASYFVDYFIKRNENAFKDSALGLLDKVFSRLALDSEGISKNSLYYDRYDGSMAEYSELIDGFENTGETGIIKAAGDKIGYENVYFFTYDWRKSAKELAGDLNAFIENVLNESDKDKVNIAAVSMGGMVSTAYLYYHGSSAVNNLTYISSAHNGTYSCGDCINGSIYFHGSVFYQQAKKSAKNNVVGRFFIEILNKIGLFNGVAAALNAIVEKNADILNDATLRDNLGTLLGFWSLCPDDIFDSAVEFIFGGHEEEYPVLLNKIEGIREFIFSTEDTIDSAIEDGVNITFISNYGLPLRPYFEHSDMMGDNVLETRLTSSFATTANHGEILTDEQIAAADPKYLSPDKTVDATTAFYRDVTWFVKDAPHVSAEYESEYADFVLWLVLSDEQPTVLTNEKYPQFMLLDSEKKLVADK